MLDPRIATFRQEADKILSHLSTECSRLQTGRASAALIEHIDVEAYGQKQELRSLAGILIQDARTIVVQPWDRAILGDIEKTLQKADLGVNPVNDGTIIRLNLPPLTQERREHLKKVVSTLAEDARIAIRQARQKAHDACKQENNEDTRRTLESSLQKELVCVNGKIDELRKKKEGEVMNI